MNCRVQNNYATMDGGGIYLGPKVTVEPGAGNAVDCRVMQLGVNGELTISQTLDQVHFPERAAAVEQRRMQLGYQSEQFAVPARRRKRRLPDVIVEVDIRVFLPIERTESPEHARGDAVCKRPPKLGGRTIAVTELGHELPLVHAIGELEQAQAGHVHRRFRRFEIQEPRFQEVDSVHALILPKRG